MNVLSFDIHYIFQFYILKNLKYCLKNPKHLIRYLHEGFFYPRKKYLKIWAQYIQFLWIIFFFSVSIFQTNGELIFLDQMIAKIMHNFQIFDNRIRLISTTPVIWANFISIKLFQHVKTIRDFSYQFWWWIRKMLGSPVNVRLIKLALLFRGFTQS